jgi:hypothetical protein
MGSVAVLFLVEFCSPDSQAAWGTEHIDLASSDNVDDMRRVPWRNLWGLWGVLRQFVDGFNRLDTSYLVQLEANDGSGGLVTTDYVAPWYGNLGYVYPLTMHTGQGEGYDFGDVFFPDTFTNDISNATFPDLFVGRSNSEGCSPHVGSGSPPTERNGVFSINFNGSGGAYNSSLTSRIAKYGEPIVYGDVAAVPKTQVDMNAAFNSATIIQPGGMKGTLRFGSTVGAIKIDIPPHSGSQITSMSVKLLGMSGSGSWEFDIYCRQSPSVWPGTKSAVCSSNFTGNPSKVRFATDSEGKHCIIIGETSTAWGLLYASIREVQLLYPNDAYLALQRTQQNAYAITNNWRDFIYNFLYGFEQFLCVKPSK